MDNNITDRKAHGGTGDKGLTTLQPGSQVSKADERVAAIGGTEEIIAALGLVRAVTPCPIFTGKLTRVQKTLRTLAQGLADPRGGKFVFSAEEIGWLESDMAKMQDKLGETDRMDDLPGGHEQSARLDAARSVTRRAERALITMGKRYAVPDTFKMYINRLGDWLLTAARYSDLLAEEADNKPETIPTAVPAPAVPAPATAVPASVPIATTAPTVPATDPTVEAVLQAVISRLGGAPVMDLSRATRLIEAVEARARETGKKAVIAVVNAEGNPIAVHCMDGAFLVSYEVAVKKAYTAVAVKMPTMELSRLVQPGGTFYGLQNLDKIVTFGGGIPLTVGGAIVGGLGVSGGTGEEDHELALYGVSVFNTL